MWTSEYSETLFILGNLLIYFHKLGLNKTLKREYGIFQ